LGQFKLFIQLTALNKCTNRGAICEQPCPRQFYPFLIISRSGYFTGKDILQREKEHCAIFIRAHFH